MRIAIVNQHPRDVTGGSELQCDLLARGLTRRGHAVRFVVVGPDGAAQGPLDDLPYATVRVSADAAAIVAACRDHRADVVYWRMNRPGLGAVVRGLAEASIPLVFATAHVDDVSRWPVRTLPPGLGPRGVASELRTRLRERLEWRALRGVAGHAAQREDFLGRTPVRPERLVRNVLDPELIDPRTIGSLGRGWTWPRPYVAWVGNIKHRKRPEELLPLVGPLREAGVDLVVVGAVTEDRYATLLTPEHAGEGVHALGPLPLPDVLDVLAGARALVVTAREEGFSNVLVQSWWHGTPVVSLGYDPDGLIVRHGLGTVCGEDRAAFRTAVVAAASDEDPGRRAAISAFARATFALDPNLDALEALLDEVVAMPVRVELVGAPGSGKTTLVAALAGARVGASGARCVPAERLGRVPRRPLAPFGGLLARPWAVGVLAAAPRLARVLTTSGLAGLRPSPAHAALRDLARARPPSGPRGEASYRRDALGWLDRTLAFVDVAERAPAGLVPVLAEGLAQRSLTVLGADVDPDHRAALLRMLPPPRLLVHLRATPELLLARAQERLAGGGGTDLHRGRDPEEVARLVTEDAVALEATVQALGALGWPVLTLAVDGADAASLAAQVVARLAEDGRR